MNTENNHLSKNKTSMPGNTSGRTSWPAVKRSIVGLIKEFLLNSIGMQKSKSNTDTINTGKPENVAVKLAHEKAKSVPVGFFFNYVK